jgi:two-component sensor histidine kinase
MILGDRTLALALDESVILATSQLSIWVLVRQLRAEAVRADAAHRSTIGEQAQAARLAAEQDATIAAQRTLHDRVLAALILLVNHLPRSAGPTTAETSPDASRPVPEPVVRGECRRAAQAVAALGSHAAQAETLVAGDELRRRLETETAAAAASTGVHVTVRSRGGIQQVLMPAHVAEAISAAVAESLRNVGRHAGVEQAEVSVSTAGTAGLLVEVVDHGRGLQPGSVSGFGLRHSVSARLREVGGEARIDSSPGGGTRVTLRWEPLETGHVTAPSVPEPELTRIPLHPRTLAATFAATLMIGALYLAAGHPSTRGPGWADAAVGAGVLAYTAWCVVAVPWPAALRYTHGAGFVVLPGLLAAGLYLAGEGALRGFDCWIVGMSGIPVVLLAMVRQAAPVLTLAVLESTVVAAAAVLDPSLTPLDVLAPVTQTPMFVALVVYGIGAIQRVRVSAEVHERALSAALVHRQAIDVRQEALGTHYRWLDTDVRPFLEAVADGGADPADGAVQERANVLALAVRDELAVPAQLGEPVRRHIADARRQGIRVRVRASDHWSPTAHHHRELEGLLGLLATDGDVTDISVSLPQPSTPLRVVVRPRLSSHQHAAALALLGARLLDIDEDDLASILTVHPGHPEYA